MFVLLKRAHALADRSLNSFEASLSKYSTEIDLKVLKVGYVICRRRREMDKCKLLASRIETLKQEIDNEHQGSN